MTSGDRVTEYDPRKILLGSTFLFLKDKHVMNLKVTDINIIIATGALCRPK